MLSVLGTKTVHIGVMLALPMALLPQHWETVLAVYAASQAIMSVLFVLIVAGTHVSDPARYPAPGPDGKLAGDWVRHQFLTSVDWCPENTVLVAAFGGANAHVAHHLLPRISHGHHVALSRILAELAEKHGMPYSRTSAAGMLAAHWRALRLLGSDEAGRLIGGAFGPEQALEEGRGGAQALGEGLPVDRLGVHQQAAQGALVESDIGQGLVPGQAAVAIRVVARDQIIDADDAGHPEAEGEHGLAVGVQARLFRGVPGREVAVAAAQFLCVDPVVAIGIGEAPAAVDADGGGLALADGSGRVQETCDRGLVRRGGGGPGGGRGQAGGEKKGQGAKGR